MRLSREIRDSYIQREYRTHGRKNGYVTQGQEARLTRWLPRIGLPKEKTLDEAGFVLSVPVVMEIGFGNGDFLTHLASRHPEWNLIGVEIYLPGVAKAVSRLEDAGVIERVRISQLPAQFVLNEQVPAGRLHGVYINHPDPWPKPRHHKRRLIQKDFARLLVSRLEPGGFLRLATDIAEMADWMREILDATPGLRNMAGHDGFVSRDPDRPATKFESRGERAGRESRFLHYVREVE
ncbi:MAG TPA: tRNA (guanosine(46)-N7)-methyltransferase TrmB [Mariprofundaceae bacterium]|nr:tRNA (guanosine(46)-N7)-methyltransferase TrmB [Mariprofundaceae bacterium]